MEHLIWHDLESGGYAADLDFWMGLPDGRVLELGAGAGRVALALALSGFTVTAVDLDEALLGELRHRAAALEAHVETLRADALTLDLGRSFEHVVAPAAFVQLFAERADRIALLAAAGRHLAPGGTLWLAVHPDLDEVLFDPSEPPGPAWVGPYESRLVHARREGDRVIVRFRRRDRVGDRTTTAEVTYADADGLEAEAGEAGLVLRERIPLPADARYSGSEILRLVRAGSGNRGL